MIQNPTISMQVPWRLIAALVVGAATSFLVMSIGLAHWNSPGQDAVDASNMEMRYTKDMTYFTYAPGWARDRWNAMGEINIFESSSGTDLHFSEVWVSGVSWTARYGYRSPGVDQIEFNRYNLINKTS